MKIKAAHSPKALLLPKHIWRQAIYHEAAREARAKSIRMQYNSSTQKIIRSVTCEVGKNLRIFFHSSIYFVSSSLYSKIMCCKFVLKVRWYEILVLAG